MVLEEWVFAPSVGPCRPTPSARSFVRSFVIMKNAEARMLRSHEFTGRKAKLSTFGCRAGRDY